MEEFKHIAGRSMDELVAGFYYSKDYEIGQSQSTAIIKVLDVKDTKKPILVTSSLFVDGYSGQQQTWDYHIWRMQLDKSPLIMVLCQSSPCYVRLSTEFPSPQGIIVSRLEYELSNAFRKHRITELGSGMPLKLEFQERR